MGFEIFGNKVFDLSRPFSHFEMWSAIVIVVSISLLVFLLMYAKAKKYQNNKLCTSLSRKQKE